MLPLRISKVLKEEVAKGFRRGLVIKELQEVSNGIEKVPVVIGYLGEGSSRKESLRVGTMFYDSFSQEKRLISHFDGLQQKKRRERIEVK